jgi:hypothetical protein
MIHYSLLLDGVVKLAVFLIILFDDESVRAVAPPPQDLRRHAQDRAIVAKSAVATREGGGAATGQSLVGPAHPSTPPPMQNTRKFDEFKRKETRDINKSIKDDNIMLTTLKKNASFSAPADHAPDFVTQIHELDGKRMARLRSDQEQQFSENKDFTSVPPPPLRANAD